jgi:hypothetical protein
MVPQTIGEYFDPPLSLGLGQGAEKYPIVFFVTERRLPGRTPFII